MHTNELMKETVKEKYGAIAVQSETQGSSSCCGAAECSTSVYSIMADDYSKLEGYNSKADLGLGCGLPTEFAKIKEGDVVVDLGSGAGNDAFVVRRSVGEKGKVIGIDFTPAMVVKARANAEKMLYQNVEFREGDIEDMPVTSNHANVVVSNCVLNLVPNKHKVFSEVFRILQPGGHFSIADIVLQGSLPAKWKEVAELYAGCISGAIQKEEYLSIIQEAGFINITVQKEREIVLPSETLEKYLSAEEAAEYLNGHAKIISITVYAEKPVKDKRNCCEPGHGCC
jgi:arsenite methyltransferase